MPVHRFQCIFRPANWEALIPSPPDMPETSEPSHHPLFFLKLVVIFHKPHAQNQRLTTRHTFEYFTRPYVASELFINVWDAVLQFMNGVNVPKRALNEAFCQLLMCAATIGGERGSELRVVLPIEGFVVVNSSPGNEEPPLIMILDKVRDDQVGIDCSICLKEMEAGVIVGNLPCLHIFHEKCINEWLANGRSCPNCRFQLG